MKKKLLTLATLFVFSNSLIAQSIPDAIPDELIEEARNQLTQDQFMSLQPDDRDFSESIERNEETPSVEIQSPDSNKYGYDFFSTVPTSISAVGDLPLPNDYKISLRDQFTVILSGSKEAIFNLDVKLDGTILFPELGSVSVVNETFGEVKLKLKNLVNQSYIGVQIDLSIKELAAKKITIVGAVKTPGTYLINPFSTISSALAYSGGISEIGTLRNIKLLRTSGEIYNFDLYKLLINGDRSDDITIEAGDVILIGPAKQFVNLDGEVQRPAIYEIKESETLEDLIRFGLGFTQIANKSSINFSILDIESSSIKNKRISDLSSSLKNVLSVGVNKFVSKDIGNILVGGAIKEPGFYSLENSKTLEELIKTVELVDAYPWLGVLEQFDNENLLKSTTLFSLNDSSTFESVDLLPNSKIYFANINERSFDVSPMTQDLISEYELNINYKQDTFTLPVFGRFSIKSFVDFLGLDMSDVDEQATYTSPFQNSVVNKNYKEMEFIANKFHTIQFRSPINDLIKVKIQGAVDYPGEYTLQPNSTLDDLFRLVGDFKDEAFFDGIIFTRESIRERQLKAIEKSKQDLTNSLVNSMQTGNSVENINIISMLSIDIEPEYLGRIAGDFSPLSSSSEKTILLDGDSIVVPRNPNAISVLGEVLNPISFEYKKDISIVSAISGAGGYKDYADKRSVYVIKANGLIEKPNRNIFTRNVSLEPGDTIVVPRKMIIDSPGIAALVPLTNILSDLAFSAAALENLQEN